jgi:hypothetical protein
MRDFALVGGVLGAARFSLSRLVAAKSAGAQSTSGRLRYIPVLTFRSNGGLAGRCKALRQLLKNHGDVGMVLRVIVVRNVWVDRDASKKIRSLSLVGSPQNQQWEAALS